MRKPKPYSGGPGAWLPEETLTLRKQEIKKKKKEKRKTGTESK